MLIGGWWWVVRACLHSICMYFVNCCLQHTHTLRHPPGFQHPMLVCATFVCCVPCTHPCMHACSAGVAYAHTIVFAVLLAVQGWEMCIRLIEWWASLLATFHKVHQSGHLPQSASGSGWRVRLSHVCGCGLDVFGCADAMLTHNMRTRNKSAPWRASHVHFVLFGQG